MGCNKHFNDHGMFASYVCTEQRLLRKGSEKRTDLKLLQKLKITIAGKFNISEKFTVIVLLVVIIFYCVVYYVICC